MTRFATSVDKSGKRIRVDLGPDPSGQVDVRDNIIDATEWMLHNVFNFMQHYGPKVDSWKDVTDIFGGAVDIYSKAKDGDMWGITNQYIAPGSFSVLKSAWNNPEGKAQIQSYIEHHPITEQAVVNSNSSDSMYHQAMGTILQKGVSSVPRLVGSAFTKAGGRKKKQGKKKKKKTFRFRK